MNLNFRTVNYSRNLRFTWNNSEGRIFLRPLLFYVCYRFYKIDPRLTQLIQLITFNYELALFQYALLNF